MGMMVMLERQTFWNGRRPEFNATEAMIEKFCRSRRAKGSVKRVKFFPSGLSGSRMGLLCKWVPYASEFLDAAPGLATTPDGPMVSHSERTKHRCSPSRGASLFDTCYILD